MQQKQNEKISIAVGFLLIILVGIVTYARMAKNQNEQETTSTSAKPTVSIKTIKPEDLQEKLQQSEKITIIDIRDEASYMESHILDSINISTDTLIDPQQELRIPTTGLIVLVGQNSTDEIISGSVGALEKRAFKNIMVLSGGLTGWKNIGGTVISSGNPTSITDLAKVTLLSKEELQKELNASDVQIIDARPAEQYRQGHIRSAISIPFEEIEQRRAEIDPKKIIVVYDNDEIQGFQSGVRINDLFMTTPFVLRGGFTKWKEANLEVVQ